MYRNQGANFEELKKNLYEALILALHEGIYELALSNELGVGSGCVLTQQNKVIVYTSQKLRVYGGKYPTHDLELVVVVFHLKISKTLSL